MNYDQLIQPNLTIVGQDGECLVYVREVFGVPAKYPTASAAWQNAIQHTGTPPSNVAVPIWFSWETDGHVAVWDNGTIYSTTAQGDKTFSSIASLTAFIGEGIEYLGWSEDINNVRVVQGASMVDKTQIPILLAFCWGSEPVTPADLTKLEAFTTWDDIVPLVLGDSRAAAWYPKEQAYIAQSGTPTVLAPGLYEVSS